MGKTCFRIESWPTVKPFPTIVRRPPGRPGVLTLAAALLAARLARVVGEDVLGQLVGALLELVHHGVVERVLVLLQPADQVVRHLVIGSVTWYTLGQYVVG